MKCSGKSVRKNPPKVGDRHGKLTVIKVAVSGTGYRMEMKCDCGSTVSRQASEVFGNQSCYAACMKNGCRRTIHGHNHKKSGPSLTYGSWGSMKSRVLNPNHMHHKTYAARKICDRWMDFKSFLEDMGERPSSKHSLERIDNNKGYFKENCVWGTQTDQNNNKVNNRFATFNGETLTYAQWARKFGVSNATISHQITRHGIKEAIRFIKEKYGK